MTKSIDSKETKTKKKKTKERKKPTRWINGLHRESHHDPQMPPTQMRTVSRFHTAGFSYTHSFRIMSYHLEKPLW